MIPTRRIEDWLRGIDAAEADRALLAAGLDLDAVALSSTAPIPVVAWRLTEAQFALRRNATAAAFADALPQVDGLRLALETDALPDAIVPRLLRVPSVASAFVAVRRPAGALRPRPWRWPLRIGLVGFPEAAADEISAAIGAAHRYLPGLLDVARVEDEPGAVDVAVVEAPLATAVEELVRRRLVANAIVVLDAPLDGFPVLDGLLAAARAATGAVASALIAPTDLTRLLTALVEAASHASGFDVALTAAAERAILLWAEPDAMMRATVPAIALGAAAELAAAPAFELAVTPGDLISAAGGAFAGERHEATRIADMNRRLQPELDAIVEERWCQARVGDDNTLRPGSNAVAFFVGPREAGALAAPAVLDESALPFAEEQAEAFRLTVLFIPAAPDAVAQQAELELPRFGRSPDVHFSLEADGDEEVSARILLLFRNRILQTAVLSGRIGETASLGEVVALVPSLTGLDDRRPFDLALFANHTGGRRTLTRHSDGVTQISSAGDVPAIAEAIADVLGAAAIDRRSLKKGVLAPAAKERLVELAVLGRDLHKELRHELGELGDPKRIQLVTARPSWLLPLEALYEREAPDPTAELCANYLADPDRCTGRCDELPPRRSLCPNAFWGLGKTIERHRYDPATDPALADGYRVIGRKAPRRGKRDLKVDRALLGASRRVTPADSAATVRALGQRAAAAAGWDAWETELAGQDTQLLVLLPHTDYKKRTLEIAASTLERGRIEPRYVTGGRDVDPIVILFGCRTTGTRGSPGGFAASFLEEGACAVFHSAADLRNVHATELARRLAAVLTLPGHRPRILSDALLEFRRAAVRDGLVPALGIAAFGDADWRI